MILQACSRVGKSGKNYKIKKEDEGMDSLKKFVGWFGMAIAGFGLVAGTIVATGWVILIIVGLAISWLSTVEWKEV